MSGQCVAQFLCLFVFFHQFTHAVHIRSCVLQLSLHLLHVLVDDVHTEVQDEVLNALAQVVFALLAFEAATELVAVNAQRCRQSADFGVGMLHEIAVGLEVWILGVFHCLLQYLVV